MADKVVARQGYGCLTGTQGQRSSCRPLGVHSESHQRDFVMFAFLSMKSVVSESIVMRPANSRAHSTYCFRVIQVESTLRCACKTDSLQAPWSIVFLGRLFVGVDFLDIRHGSAARTIVYDLGSGGMMSCFSRTLALSLSGRLRLGLAAVLRAGRTAVLSCRFAAARHLGFRVGECGWHNVDRRHQGNN